MRTLLFLAVALSLTGCDAMERQRQIKEERTVHREGDIRVQRLFEYAGCTAYTFNFSAEDYVYVVCPGADTLSGYYDDPPKSSRQEAIAIVKNLPQRMTSNELEEAYATAIQAQDGTEEFFATVPLADLRQLAKVYAIWYEERFPEDEP